MAHTLVCFHAHPDDEALLTAGVMAKAAAAGHRVVLVVATRGDVGLVAGDFLGEGEALADRRWRELEESARLLGVDRLEWLGYADSGSTPTGAGATDEATGTGRADDADDAAADTTDTTGRRTTPFAAADVDEAAGRLAAILEAEHADVLTTYDPNGGYGHPDHLQVHRVGARAAELAGTPVVLEATINRDLMRMGVDIAASLGFELPPNFAPEAFDAWYLPEAELTHAVDVRDHLDAKKAAMTAHASQATADGDDTTRSLEIFVSLPPEYFELAFGTEWFVDRSRPAGIAADDVFATLTERG
jgi:LmbE family N-acetylglucosaminyl deacetylase